MKKVVVFLLIAFLLKQLVWLAVIPIWHFPDEEQHFAQAAFYAEKGNFPQYLKVKEDVNLEIDRTSEILGTKRDSLGINKFTYHPEFRIPYSNSQIGIFEEEIKALNTKENRQTMVKREAARYGPVYYWLVGQIYKLFYQRDIFTRVFASRFVSLFLSALNVFFVYLIAKELFSGFFLRFVLTFLVAFQPMFSFVSSGVNSDNLFNLIFTIILYSILKIFFCAKDFLTLKNLKYWFLLTLALITGFYSKPQIYISIPVIFLAYLLSFLLIKNNKLKKRNFFLLLLIILLGVLFFFFSNNNVQIPEYEPQHKTKMNENFFQYIFWHLKHTVAETIPWYWGVFNWLGVPLPRWVNRLQARILILSVFGFIVYLIKVVRKKYFFSSQNFKIIFLILSSLIYYFSIISWDFFFRSSQGYSFGIQGRYFFPTIVSHMLLIVLGLFSLTSKKIIGMFILKILAIWWVFLSLIGLNTAVKSYYQLFPIGVFLNQASQYKVSVFKGYNLLFLVILFFLSLIFLLIYILFFNERKIRTNN